MKKIMLVVIFCLGFYSIGFTEMPGAIEAVQIPVEYHGVWKLIMESEDQGKTFIHYNAIPTFRVSALSILDYKGVRHAIDRVFVDEDGVAFTFTDVLDRFWEVRLGKPKTFIMLRVILAPNGKEVTRMGFILER